MPWRRYGQTMASAQRFADRADAGRRLAAILEPGPGPALVLGLARGGVPVAAEVARALGAALDVLVVRKVGHPRQPEYALGAVSEDGVVLPAELPPDLVEPELARAHAQAIELRRGHARHPVAGKRAIVVDDGLATGRSMRVAVETVARLGPARILVAVPVASAPGLSELAADWEMCALVAAEPGDFVAVGQFYDDFRQVDDAAVAELLALSAGGLPQSS